ncbi:hypothetical protein ES702_06085 [subsurface metagenome]
MCFDCLQTDIIDSLLCDGIPPMSIVLELSANSTRAETLHCDVYL